MAALEIITQSQGNIVVKGDLTFASINKKTSALIDFKQSRYSEGLTIDLSEVNNSDSAGLALIVEWIKLSKYNKGNLSFKDIPEQLLTLASLSGFENNEYFLDSES